MTTQLDLSLSVAPCGLRPLARNTDPVTSHAAAREHVATGRHGRQCNAVLAAVQCHPGRTSAELAHDFQIDRHVVARRTSDLEKRGLVRKGAVRLCRIGGRQAVTWWAIVDQATRGRP